MLTLHETYSRDEAVDRLGGRAPSVALCDGQFEAVGDHVLCFFTLRGEAARCELAAPSTVVWHPAPVRAPRLEVDAWLPGAAREVKGRRAEVHQVFLREVASEPFLYVGPAHLGSYGGPGGAPSARFSLRERLPRSTWLAFGGYPGWRIELNHASHFLMSGQTRELDSLVRRSSELQFGHLVMTRYEEDALHLHTNRSRGWLMYLPDPDDPGLYVRGSGPATPHAVEEFRCSCGITLELPASQTSTLEEAFEVVRRFFRDGVLPRPPEWTDTVDP